MRSKIVHQSEKQLDRKCEDKLAKLLFDSYEEGEAVQQTLQQEVWTISQQLKSHFPQVNAPSVQFSQNSLMLSKRHDESGYDERRDSKDSRISKHDQTVKEIANRTREALDKANEALDEANTQIEKQECELQKKSGLIDGLKVMVSQRETEIAHLEEKLEELEGEVKKISQDKSELMNMLSKKDDAFRGYRKESKKAVDQILQKEKTIKAMEQTIQSLTEQNKRLSHSFTIFHQGNKNLLQFQGKHYAHQNNRETEKNIEKLKKQNYNLITQISNMENQYRQREKYQKQQFNKIISVKEKKINQLEQKIFISKEQINKGNKNNQNTLESVRDNLNTKIKQITDKNDKIMQLQRRIKSSSEDLKKKQEKIRQLNIDVIEKGKSISQKIKLIQDLKIKSQFDSHLLKENQKQIERLRIDKKELYKQIEQNEKDKMLQTDKQYRQRQGQKAKKQFQKQFQRTKKEMQRYKKQNQTIKKDNQQLCIVNGQIKQQMNSLHEELQSLQKQCEQKQKQQRQLKKKTQQSTKKMQQYKSALTELQQKLQQNEHQLTETKELVRKNAKQQHQLRKKAEAYPQLTNKIIILQSRVKELTQRQDEQSYDSDADKIAALQHMLQNKENQIRELKSMISTMPQQQSQWDLDQLQKELVQQSQRVQEMSRELQQSRTDVRKLQSMLMEKDRDIQMKEDSLQYLHSVLLEQERKNIALLQKQKENHQDSFGIDQEVNKVVRAYQQKISSLQGVIRSLQKKLKEKGEEVEEGKGKETMMFQIRELKKRVKELSDLALSKERKFSAQALSQEETVEILTKLLKKVVRSHEMMKILLRDHDFKECIHKLEKQTKR